MGGDEREAWGSENWGWKLRELEFIVGGGVRTGGGRGRNLKVGV